jgi:hypothetical protein
VRELLAPLRGGEGVRIGAVGITGSGKSYALREVVARAAPAIDVLYVIDDKDRAKDWKGQARIDLDDARARPLVRRRDGGSNVVVFTGDPFARRRPDPESIARDAWRVAAQGFTCAEVLDELRRACRSPQHWEDPAGDCPRILTEGRSVGLSLLWGTQFPQEVPREAFSMSDVLLFLCEAGELDYLVRKRVISQQQADVVSRLENGQFVVRRLGKPWDGTIFRF